MDREGGVAVVKCSIFHHGDRRAQYRNDHTQLNLNYRNKHDLTCGMYLTAKRKVEGVPEKWSREGDRDHGKIFCWESINLSSEKLFSSKLSSRIEL